MTRRHVGWAAGAVLGAMLVGCEMQQPQESPAPQEPVFQAVCLEDAMNIGPDGGVLSCGVYTLTIPPGALSTTVYITMAQESCGQWPVQLGPDGTQFAVPATLEFDAYGEPNPEKMNVAWWNPSTQSWEDQPTSHDGNVVSTQIGHFSRWVLH